MSRLINIGKKKDFPLNQTRGVIIDGQEVCISNNNGKFTSFNNSCTHAKARLSDLPIDDGQIECPLHGATFDVITGAPRSLPAVKPIQLHPVRIESDDILVEWDT